MPTLTQTKRPRLVPVLSIIAIAFMLAGNARAAGQNVGDQGSLCRNAIRQAEVGSGLPANLLGGIARVESGRRDPVSGQFNGWPWTINSEGRGHFFETKADAIAYARDLRARGVQSFDVGCLQINVMHHPDAFVTLDDAFDPVVNAQYAVRFLQSLKEKLGSWEDATAWYHSGNPELGVPYRGLVENAMAEEAKLPAPPIMSASASRPPPVPASLPMMAMGGAFSRAGNAIMLPRAGMGTVMASGQAMLGRGLDSYRAMPVAIAGFRTLAAR